MEQKILLKLQKIFTFVAWISLVSTIFVVGMKAYDFYKSSTGIDQGFFYPQVDYYLLKDCIELFGYIAQTFFLFLVSAVFKMLAHKKPVELDQAQRFLKICCGAYLIESFFVLLKWVVGVSGWYNSACSPEVCGFLLSIGQHFTYIFKFLTEITPAALMAVTVFVLFNHFTKLLAFESEVA